MLAPMQTDVPMARLAANGLEIGYDVHGEGPPLVMLHSASSSGREDFAAQLPLLRRSFTCYLPDARGHATTRWDAADGFRYDWLVDDLEAFADALGLADLPPARVLDGGGDGPAVRRAPAGAAAVARGGRDLATPRAPDVGRAPDDGPGVHQATTRAGRPTSRAGTIPSRAPARGSA